LVAKLPAGQKKIASSLENIALRLRLKFNVSNELFLGDEFDRLEPYDEQLEQLKTLIVEA
jgi:hypothetical protein